MIYITTTIIILFLAAIIMEFIDSSLGMMYGTILSPLLIIYGYDPLFVVPSILLSQGCGGFIATYQHNKYNNAEFNSKSKDLKIAGLIFVLGVIAVIIGEFVGIHINKDYLKIYIGILCIIMGSIVILKRKFKFSWKKISLIGAISAFNKSLCYDKNTEILTKERGWIQFKDLTKNDYVATLNDRQVFIWNKPIDLQEYQYNDNMIRINHESVDLLVTPNHKLYLREQNNKKYKLIEANKLYYYAYKSLNKVEWNGEEREWFYLTKVSYNKQCHNQFKEVERIKMDNWLEFLGWYISEGFVLHTNSDNAYRVCISQTKDKYVKDIEKCLNRLGYKWYKNDNDYII